MKNERNRNFAMVTYHSRETVENVLKLYLQLGRVRHYAFIVHDKDKKPDGELKETHIHILLQLNNAMTLSALRNLFPNGNTTLGQPLRDKMDCFNYLTHKNTPEKYQYNENDIISDDLQYWKEAQKTGSENDRTCELIRDILNNVDYWTMLDRYGRDYVINFDKYHSFASRVSYQQNQAVSATSKPCLIDEETGEVEHPKPKQLSIE